MNYLIPEQLANALVQYLALKPYAEVFQLLQEMQKLQPAEKPEGDTVNKEDADSTAAK